MSVRPGTRGRAAPETIAADSGGWQETRFYEWLQQEADAAPELLRQCTPSSVLLESSPGFYLFVLSDLRADGFPTHVRALTPQLARLGLAMLARFHASWWCAVPSEMIRNGPVVAEVCMQTGFSSWRYTGASDCCV